MQSYEWELIQYDWCPFNERRLRHRQHTEQGTTMWEHREKAAVCKPTLPAP